MSSSPLPVLTYPMIQPTFLLGLPAHLRLGQIEITPQKVILSLTVETSEATCPLCQQTSYRVHSHYTRTLQDVPCVGKTRQLLVLVRRFFCKNEACARKIFAERLPELASVYARRTTRSKAALTELGFALEGKAAASLSAHLGLPSNRMTILRILRRTPVPVAPTTKMLGVDEWASSPSRLLRHPRPDRGRCKQGAWAVLVERYEAVQRLIKQGFSHRAIARHLHMHRESGIRYAKAERFPERPERAVHPGILAPYETYLRTRFLEGERNGVGLFREITAREYTGSRMTVERFLLGLRAMEQQGIEISKTATTIAVTPRRAVGLMLRRDEDLTEEEKVALSQVRQLHPSVMQTHTLFRFFAHMVRERRGEELDLWMQQRFTMVFSFFTLP